MAIKASASVTIADVSDGLDGTGIASAVVEYQAGSSGTTAPTGTWSTSTPSTSASSPYLWTRVTYTYTDGRNPQVVYSVGSTPEGIEVGGRNLLLRSNYKTLSNISSNSKSKYGFYNASIDVHGELGSVYNLSLDTNVEYTVSFIGWLESSDTSVTYEVCVDLFSDNLPETTRIFTTSPQRFVWTFKSSSSDMASCQLRFFVDTQPIDVPSYITDIKLEKGNKATDWTPAPEDVDAAIDEVEQKIEFVVGSGSTASSVTLTEAAIQAITRQFTIKDYSGGTTVISGGKIITDDLRSLSAKIAGWEIGDGYIRDKDANNRYVGIGRNGVTYAFFAGGTAADGGNANFRVNHAGQLIATDAIITGNITATTLLVQQSIYSETTTIIDTTGIINYKNILSTNAEGGYNSYLGIYAESDHYSGSGAVDRAKITFALNDNRAYNGAREADINLYASGYIRISADEQVVINDCTFNGSVTFANGTWNLVGDDVYIGDHNVGGALCIKSAMSNYPTGIVFYAPDESSTGHLYYATPNGTFQTNCGLNLPSFDAGQICQLRLSWAGTSVIFRYDGSDFYIMPSDGDTGTSGWSCVPFAIGRTGVVSIMGPSMVLNNGVVLYTKGTDGVSRSAVVCSPSNNFLFGNGGYTESFGSTYYSGNTVYLRANTHLYRNLSWEQGSDARLKHGVIDMPAEFLAAYMDIKPVQFFWNDKPQLGRQYGVIAQQVLEALENNGISNYDANIVSLTEDAEMFGFNAYTVNYDFLNVLTMAVVQNHEKRIKELEKELALLKDTNGLKEE